MNIVTRITKVLFPVTFFCALICCTHAEAQNAPSPQSLTGITYSLSKTPNVSDSLNDLNHTALLDGNQKTRVAWNRISPYIDVDFDLKQPRQLTEISVVVSRPKKNWWVPKIDLYLDNGQGFQLVDVIDTGEKHTDEKPIPYKTYTFKNIDKPAIRARIRFEGRSFIISGVRFFGDETSGSARNPAPPSKQAAAPLVKDIYHLPPRTDAATVKEEDLNNDSDTEILLGNRYLQIVLEPTLGGVISAIKTPSGVDLTPPKNKANLGGGLLSDHVTDQAYRNGDWTNVPYQYEIVDKGPDKVSVRMWRRGSNGALAFITVSKTITLYRDRSDIQVDYAISNAYESLVPLSYQWWFHSFAGAYGWKKPGTLKYFYPMPSGVESLDPSSKIEGNDYQQGPARGWTGFVDIPKETGLAFKVDYHYLSSFYNYWTDSSPMPTLEWRFLKFPINNGDTFKTQIIIQPFQGLYALSGVSAQAVGNMDYSGDNLNAQIIPNFNGKANLELRWKRLPDTTWQTLKQQDVQLKTSTKVELSAPITLKDNGTYVLSAVLRDGAKVLIEMEKPVVKGDSKALYTLSQESAQYRPPGGSLNLKYVSDKLKTPHVDWAKPYAEGKTKAILFTSHKLDRDIIELAQRMDLDFDTSFIYGDEMTYALGDYVANLSQHDINEGVKKLFERSPNWQVIVMPGKSFGELPATYQKLILDKVQNEGRGLVIIDPTDPSTLDSALPVGKRGGMKRDLLWKQIKDNAITRGIPFNIMPPTGVFEYPVKSGDVLAKAGDNPLVVTGNYGKGRVVTLLYRATPDARGKVKDLKVGLMPMMYGYNSDLPDTPNIHFAHEYQFSLLAKATLWAANNEPKLILHNVVVSGQKAQVRFDNTQASSQGKFTWIIRDTTGKEQARGGSAADFTAGQHTAEVSLQNPVARGSIDFWLRNNKGEIWDWGSYSFDNKDDVHLAKVVLDKDVIKPGEPLSVKVLIAAAPQKPTSIRVQVTDGFNRLLSQQTIPMVETQNNVKLLLPSLINEGLKVRVDLYQSQLLQDSWQQVIPVQFPLKNSSHEGDPYMVPWTGFASYTRAVPSYLFDAYFQQMKNVGFNGWMLNPGENIDAITHSALRHNMKLSLKLNGFAGMPLAADSTPEKPTLKTSPYDQSAIKRTLEQGAREPEKYAKYNAFETVAGDENSLSRNKADVSFDPAYLSAFRVWLKTRYASLNELNQHWDTTFANWDDVMPITLKMLQATGTRNFTRWSDFRAFGDYTFTEFFSRETKAAQKVNPLYRVTISGSQYPNPYNGYDYWQLSKNLNSIIAYFGVGEMVSFDDARKIDIREWASEIRNGGAAAKYRIYNQFFNGVTGLNFWTDSLLVRPDLSLSTVGNNFKDAYEPFKNGMGRMLISAKLQKSPIAIHYSQNSMRVAEALGEYATLKGMRDDSIKLLENTGYDPRWISYEQLAEGKLQGVKVLILPYSVSLSAKEADAVRQFAQNGGTVISMFTAGQADGYGKLGNQAQLDNLFGITRTNSKIQHGEWDIKGGALDGISISEMESGLKATDSQVLASANGAPVIFSANRGKGKVLYVACDLVTSYTATNSSRTVKDYAARSAQTETFITKLLEASAAQPDFKVLDKNDKPVPFIKTAHFTNGTADYYGFMRDYPIASGLSVQPETVTILFPKKGYVYGVVSGKKFGFTDHVSLVLTANSGELFSMLPYDVKGIDITPSGASVKTGDSINFKLAVEGATNPVTHTFRINVFDPSGKQSDSYSTNLTAEKGATIYTLPLALNDVVGDWRVEVIDLNSGAKAAQKFEVIASS